MDFPAPDYDALYGNFDSDLMRRLRSESYGEDIGQHSWVSADELRIDALRLHLSAGRRLLDLGCGPCGPLTYLMKLTGCHALGVDVSGPALAAGRRRAASLGVEGRLTVQEANLDAQVEMVANSFDAAMALDVVLHLRDRARLFRDLARLLVPGGRVLFTDAGVVTGVVSNEEVAARSVHGLTQLCAPGYNERLLEQSGLTLLESEDRTQGLLISARARLTARERHRAGCEQLEGAAAYSRYQAYLQSIVTMAERRALSRVMYLAEARRA